MRTRMKSDERRASIVASAIKLFAEKGFRGTTTRELAAALGVTEPVLYQHFQTKEDLYRAIIETKAGEGGGSVAELQQYIAAEDDGGFFTCLADLVLSRYEKDPCFIRLLLFSALERHELARLFYEQQVRQFFDLVAGYIRKRIRKGVFREMNSGVAARAFIGMISYHGLMGLLFQDSVVKASRKKVLQQMVATFLDGIRAGGAA